jgi:phytoene synthase
LRARAGILVAARVYRAIGWQLRAREQAYLNGRVVVPAWRKAAVTSQALVAIPFSRFFWQHPVQHDDRLHAAFNHFPASSTVFFLCHAK